MTDDMSPLSRRAVACRGWRSMPGMLYADGAWRFRVGEGWHAPAGVELLPVLDDPATLGCLLALVREAWAAPRALVRLSANGKSFHVFDVDRVTTGGNWAAFLCGDHRIQTEAEALVAALESAP